MNIAGKERKPIKRKERAKFPDPLPRRMLVSALLDAYSKDVGHVVSDFPAEYRVELLDHMIACLDILTEYSKTPEKHIWKKYTDLEEAFLKKHKSRLQLYRIKQFMLYYWPESAIMETNIFSAAQFNSMSGEEQVLSSKEMEQFFNHARNLLFKERDMVLLNEEPEEEFLTKKQGDSEKETTELNGKDPAVSLSAQMLMIYYLLKQLGVEPRDTAAISDMARFAHFLLGKKVGILSNSEIYKKLKKMPNFKSDTELLKDLQAIRPHFAAVGLKDVLFEIDKEVGIIRKAKLKKNREQGS